MSIKLNTGKTVKLDIEFEGKGDNFFLEFNPCDTGLLFRLNSFVETLKNTQKEIDNRNIDEENQVEFMESISNMLKDELNNSFNSDVSKDIFKYCDPLSIIDGKYYIVVFFQSVFPEIRRHIEIANNESQERMKKHLDKYGIE